MGFRARLDGGFVGDFFMSDFGLGISSWTISVLASRAEKIWMWKGTRPGVEKV
jgi:hypothetical protein